MNWLNLNADSNPVLDYVAHRRRIDECMRVLCATCEELHSPYPDERLFKLPRLSWSGLSLQRETYTIYDLVLALNYLTEHGLTEERCYRTPDNTGIIPPYTEEYEDALTVTEWRLENARRKSLGGAA